MFLFDISFVVTLVVVVCFVIDVFYAVVFTQLQKINKS